MESLYSDEIRNYVRTRDWPRNVIWEVSEATEPVQHLNIIFFRDNWLTLEFDDQMKVASIVKEIMAKLWADGIPTYTGKMEHART